MVLMNKPGPAIKIKKHVSFLQGNDNLEYILPYKDPLSLSASQEFSQPVVEFYTFIKDVLMSTTAKLSTVTAIADGVDQLQNLLGVRLFSKYYYSQAWKGAKPSQISINLEFSRGMNGVWDSSKEVFNPILDIYSATVPYQANSTVPLTSPGPTPAGVLANFSEEIIKTAIGSVANIATGALELVGKWFGSEKDTDLSKMVSDYIQKAGNVVKVEAGVWTVDFGWHGRGEEFVSVYKLNDLIVDTSKFEFSNVMENISGKMFPVSGTISLSMKSQSITTSDDVLNNKK